VSAKHKLAPSDKLVLVRAVADQARRSPYSNDEFAAACFDGSDVEKLLRQLEAIARRRLLRLFAQPTDIEREISIECVIADRSGRRQMLSISAARCTQNGQY
jgi:hypothetical protein